ncbi:MAG: hypothetical protein ACXVCT_19780 [Ktedonobacterales bacterium]
MYRLSLVYETYPTIQDASFHGAKYLPRELLTEDYVVSIRTSNFDHLATVYDDETIVQPDVLSTIGSVLEEQGFTYVPTEILDAPFTGKNPGVSGFRTWGQRYFDYL